MTYGVGRHTPDSHDFSQDFYNDGYEVGYFAGYDDGFAASSVRPEIPEIQRRGDSKRSEAKRRRPKYERYVRIELG